MHAATGRFVTEHSGDRLRVDDETGLVWAELSREWGPPTGRGSGRVHETQMRSPRWAAVVRRDDRRMLIAPLVIGVLWLVFLSLVKGVSGGGVGTGS